MSKRFPITLSNSRRDTINTFLLALGFGLFIYCFQLFLVKIGFITILPDDKTLNQWDAGCFIDYVKNGYTYADPIFNNTGIFFLFPWIWRLLHVGAVGISIVNYLFFAFGFTLLAKIYKISTMEKLVWLSIPTVYIMYIPYSEALFFLLMTIAFYGINTKNIWLIWIGLFLAALTRATAIFLLPALLIMELLGNFNNAWHKLFLNYLFFYALPILSGLAFFVWYQHHVTGVWFVYFIQQQKTEGHIFNMPIMPLSSMEGPRMLWISALAVFCCFISIIVLGKKIFHRLFKNAIEVDKLLVLSLVFLGITLYKTVFYNPIWRTGTTLTIGINRYVFATPFFYIFLHHFTNRYNPYKAIDYITIFIICNIVWLSCGSYLHIQNFIFFNFLTLIVFTYMLMANKKFDLPPIWAVAMNLLFQITMFQQYLSGLYLE